MSLPVSDPLKNAKEQCSYFLNSVPGTRTTIDGCIQWAFQQYDTFCNIRSASREAERWKMTHDQLTASRRALEDIAQDPQGHSFDVWNAASKMGDLVAKCASPSSSAELTLKREFEKEDGSGISVLIALETVKERMAKEALRQPLKNFWEGVGKRIVRDYPQRTFGLNASQQSMMTQLFINPMKDMAAYPHSSEKMFMQAYGKMPIYLMGTILNICHKWLRDNGLDAVGNEYANMINSFNANIEPHIQNLRQCRNYHDNVLNLTL